MAIELGKNKRLEKSLSDKKELTKTKDPTVKELAQTVNDLIDLVNELHRKLSK